MNNHLFILTKLTEHKKKPTAFGIGNPGPGLE
jgi:hypothetical protein